MLNKIVIAGRIVRDIEARSTQNGKSVANFTIACERDAKAASGEKETDFVDVVAWGNTADFLSKYSGKGLMIVVEGRLQLRKYTDKDGNKRTATEVQANNVYPMEWRKGDAYEPQTEEAAPDFGDSDELLPF